MPSQRRSQDKHVTFADDTNVADALLAMATSKGRLIDEASTTASEADLGGLQEEEQEEEEEATLRRSARAPRPTQRKSISPPRKRSISARRASEPRQQPRKRSKCGSQPETPIALTSSPPLPAADALPSSSTSTPRSSKIKCCVVAKVLNSDIPKFESFSLHDPDLLYASTFQNLVSKARVFFENRYQIAQEDAQDLTLISSCYAKRRPLTTKESNWNFELLNPSELWYDWIDSGFTELTATVEVAISASNLASLPAGSASRAGAQVRGGSSTTEQRSLQQDLQQENIGAGHSNLQLTTRWLCTLNSCKNEGYLCYSQRGKNRDIATNHHPITSEVSKLWLQAIRSRYASVDEPNYAVLRRLQRQTGVIARRTKVKLQQHQTSNQQQFIVPVALPPQPQQSYHSETPGATSRAPNSSPPRIRGTPDEQLPRFFAWCLNQDLFDEADRDLFPSILDRLKRDRYDITSLYNEKHVTNDWWEGFGFPLGLLHRIRRVIRSFECNEASDASASDGHSP